MALFSSLGIDLPVLLAQLINFGILFGALYFLGYKPILRILDERANKVKESLEQAEELRKQTVNAGEEVKKKLEAAAHEGQEMVARAVKTGEEVRKKSQEDARKEADALIVRARSEIQRERDDAVDVLRHEFADLTITAASKVIDRSLDKEAHREVIEKVLKESKTLNKG